MIQIDNLSRIAEGKTKIVYENPEDENTVYLFFKDDITAGDGLKHAFSEETGTGYQTMINEALRDYLGKRIHVE